MVVGVLIAAPAFIAAQPNPASGNTNGGNPIGGGGSASPGSSIALLPAPGTGYGINRFYEARKKLAE